MELQFDLKSKDKEMQELNHNLNSELHNCKKHLTTKTAEVEALLLEMSDMKISMETENRKRNEEERTKLQRLRSEVDRKCDRARLEVEDKMRQQAKDLHDKLNVVTLERNQLIEVKNKNLHAFR